MATMYVPCCTLGGVGIHFMVLLISQVQANEAYEHSELLLYKAMVLDEGGRLDDALAVLDADKVGQ